MINILEAVSNGKIIRETDVHEDKMGQKLLGKIRIDQ